MTNEEEYDESMMNDMESFLNSLAALRRVRDERKDANRHNKRMSLNGSDRKDIFDKTGGRCHICGGTIKKKWQADHVLAHSAGGDHSPDNYLPAHTMCNNYRWDYLPAEFQLILKLGVWCRTRIEKQTSIGKTMGERFRKYENDRMTRRKKGK